MGAFKTMINSQKGMRVAAFTLNCVAVITALSPLLSLILGATILYNPVELNPDRYRTEYIPIMFGVAWNDASRYQAKTYILLPKAGVNVRMVTLSNDKIGTRLTERGAIYLWSTLALFGYGWYFLLKAGAKHLTTIASRLRRSPDQ